ncbi:MULTISPECIES: hypothetical protein [unclassified Legionella]|uniref:hypothetical protein n=1 Tax=unclassified Legionella TaxID=2622702 RepID=UPI001E3CD100|nr:hypothetical protein [Legionella sp. 31fI33]MCC5015537.1 hypothetical protein [Legionella sp. 31fI33]
MFSKFFHSKQLQSREETLQEGEITLSNAVEEYMQSITQGDYAPELPEMDWDANDEASYIERLLSPVSEYFNHLSIPPSSDAGLPAIAHLLASLTILKEMSGVKADDRLKKLEKMGVMTQVQAGMPGPCMIYIHALLQSPKYDIISKTNLLGDVISYLSGNINTFGGLGSTVLVFALKEWFAMFGRLTDKLQNILSEDKSNHMTLQEVYSTEQEEKTFVDQCILQVWDILSIDVTAIGLDKDDFPAPPAFPSPLRTNGSL